MKWTSRFGRLMATAAHRVVPDPFAIVVLLAVLVSGVSIFAPTQRPQSHREAQAAAPSDGDHAAGAALAEAPECGALGNLKARTIDTFDAWYGLSSQGASGMWSLLRFSMQMVLILVLGYALTDAPKLQEFLNNIASTPRDTASAAYLVSFIACSAALVHWGLSLILGATLARRIAIVGLERGRRLHYPLLCAAGYSGMMIWHGGLSGSGPLDLANEGSELLSAFAARGVPVSPIPLSATLFSDLNLVVLVCAVIAIPTIFRWLAPRNEDASKTVDNFLRPEDIFPQPVQLDTEHKSTWRRIEDSTTLKLAFFAFMFAGLLVTLRVQLRHNPLAVNWLNILNAFFFSLALLLHPTLRSFGKSITSAVRGAAGIIVQFPLYAGIAAVMVSAGFVYEITSWCAKLPSELFTVAAFLNACVLHVVVPSGGGQFLVQGPYLLEVSRELSAREHTWVLALAYGNGVANMIQPFWALALLGITGLRARHIIGYCFAAMILASPVFIVPLWVMG